MNTQLLKLLLFIFIFSLNKSVAMVSDTVFVNQKTLNTAALREGTNRYLVYFRMKKDGPRTETQFWTRTITKTKHNGNAAFEVTQIWEDKDSIMHIAKSISDAKTMQPLYHKTWWKVKATKNATTKIISETVVDFERKSVIHNGKLLDNTVTDTKEKSIWDAYLSSSGKYLLNWHLDLETFPILPYKVGITFLIPFYDPGTSGKLKNVAYTVTGSAKLTGYNDKKIGCWLLTHEEKGNKEIFWISKRTKEVLKLEQEINGKVYRYKIKLGFSL